MLTESGELRPKSFKAAAAPPELLVTTLPSLLPESGGIDARDFELMLADGDNINAASAPGCDRALATP